MLSKEEKDAPVALLAYWFAGQKEGEATTLGAMLAAFGRIVHQYRLEVHTKADQHRFLANLEHIRLTPELKHDVEEGKAYLFYVGQAKVYYAFEQALQGREIE